MDYTIDHKTLGHMFQEIIVEFSEMGPTELGTFENKVLDAVYRVGKGLMQWKLGEWNTELRIETCSQCGGKQENRRRSAQIATWVARIGVVLHR
jgi:hypothetical protein